MKNANIDQNENAGDSLSETSQEKIETIRDEGSVKNESESIFDEINQEV